MSPAYDAPERASLPAGAKISFIVATLLLLLAVYFFLAPTYLPDSRASAFICGSAASPNTDAGAARVCGAVEGVNRYRAIISAVAAVVVAGMGFLLFRGPGGGRRERWDDEYDLDEDHDDERDDLRGRDRRDTRDRRDARDQRDARGAGDLDDGRRGELRSELRSREREGRRERVERDRDERPGRLTDGGGRRVRREGDIDLTRDTRDARDAESRRGSRRSAVRDDDGDDWTVGDRG